MDDLIDIAISVAQEYKKDSKPVKSSNKKNKKGNPSKAKQTKPSDIPTNKPNSVQGKISAPDTVLPDSIIMPEITSSSVLQGVIWAEILGKPVSKRKGRW